MERPITTAPTDGPKLLLIKTGVTITQANGGDIDLRARGDFTLQAGALVQTTGDVDIYADEEDVAPAGAKILVLGQIIADQVTVHGTRQSDTITIGAVSSGTQMTVNAGEGDDTINIGTPAPGTVDGIDGNLVVNGEGGSDTLNFEDSGDTSSSSGTLTGTTITGFDMGGVVTYQSFASAEHWSGVGQRRDHDHGHAFRRDHSQRRRR